MDPGIPKACPFSADFCRFLAVKAGVVQGIGLQPGSLTSRLAANSLVFVSSLALRGPRLVSPAKLGMDIEISCGKNGHGVPLLMPQTVLILDDEPDNVLLIAETLRRRLPEVRTVTFTSPLEAAAWCGQNEPDLCLVDYRMPGMSGVEFIRRLRQHPHLQGVPMIMITAQPGVELQQEALDSGATDFLSKPINVSDVLTRTRNHLRMRESLRDRRLDMGRLEIDMQAASRKLIEQEQAMVIERLARLSGYRDEETSNHMRRMAHITRIIAEELGQDQHYCELLLLAAPMHDIGKVGIPDRILLKAGQLDAAEWAIMQTHTTIGYDLLKDSHSESLRLGAEIAHTHHEKFDGLGYPHGLRGDAIPLSGRIVAVSDVFDALVNSRHYKKAWKNGDAMDYLRAERGKHFDPACVNALLRRIDDALEIQRLYSDDSLAETKAGPDTAQRNMANL